MVWCDVLHVRQSCLNSLYKAKVIMYAGLVFSNLVLKVTRL